MNNCFVQDLIQICSFVKVESIIGSRVDAFMRSSVSESRGFSPLMRAQDYQTPEWLCHPLVRRQFKLPCRTKKELLNLDTLLGLNSKGVLSLKYNEDTEEFKAFRWLTMENLVGFNCIQLKKKSFRMALDLSNYQISFVISGYPLGDHGQERKSSERSSIQKWNQHRLPSPDLRIRFASNVDRRRSWGGASCRSFIYCCAWAPAKWDSSFGEYSSWTPFWKKQ